MVRKRQGKFGTALLIKLAAIFALVILFNTLGVIPLAGSVMLGCLLLFVTRCLTPQEAYDSIDWRILVLVAGMMGFAAALSKTLDLRGQRVGVIVSGGNVDLDDLRAKCEQHKADLACVMITYPSTYGVFDTQVKALCKQAGVPEPPLRGSTAGCGSGASSGRPAMVTWPR